MNEEQNHTFRNLDIKEILMEINLKTIAPFLPEIRHCP
jgi:hypothetical protein